MKAVIGVCILFLATLSVATVGSVALGVAFSLPEGSPANLSVFIVMSVCVTTFFAVRGFVDMAWPE